MNYYESLEHRISDLERFFEGKKDLDDLRSHLGDDLFDAYMQIRNRIPSGSDLNKQYPDFTAEDILEDEKLFIKKYVNLRNSNLITGIGARLFGKYPKEVSQDAVHGNPMQWMYDYDNMKNYVVNTFSNFREFEKLKKADVDDVWDFVNSYISVNDLKDQSKLEGAETIYDKDGWKVIRITTYKAARFYGSGTKWCITGRYDGQESRGAKYFRDYIKDENLDGGYYFYIKGNKKWCLLQKVGGKIHSIWNEEDIPVLDRILYDAPDWPLDVPRVNSKDIIDIQMISALYSSNKELIQMAIDKDADLNMQQGAFESPIQMYTAENEPELVKMLLDAGADPDLGAPLQNHFGYSTNIEIAKALLDHGADPNMYDTYGDSPLGPAIAEGSYEFVKLLIDAGADVNQDINCKSGSYCYEMPPTAQAIRCNELDILKLLLDNGASIHNTYNGKGILSLCQSREMKDFINSYFDMAGGRPIQKTRNLSKYDTLESRIRKLEQLLCK